jgi:hypothetical protein
MLDSKTLRDLRIRLTNKEFVDLIINKKLPNIYECIYDLNKKINELEAYIFLLEDKIKNKA